MNGKFVELIPSNSKMVLEFISEDLDTTGNLEMKEQFLSMKPDCNYVISNDFGIKSDKVDTILLDSSSFATLSVKKVTALINKVSEYLKDDGTMIFVLENLSYADNITALLNGEPPTVKATLTFDELVAAIDNSNMKVMKTLQNARETVVKRAIAEVAKTPLNIDNFIISAIKKSAEKNLKRTLIQSYLGEVLVCAGIRVNAPNQFMATKPGVYVAASNSGETLNLSNDSDYANKIFINQRVSVDNTEMGISLFNNLVRHNYLFIEEMDDHPVLWRKKYEDTEFINFIGAHAVQTSTKPLADFLSQFNPHVRIFENQLKKLPSPRNFKDEIASGEPITIFFGALNRERDLAEFLPAINKIASEYGDNILFKIIAKMEFFDAIESRNKIAIGRKEVYNGQYVPFDVYEKELHTSHISLLPLRDNVFNRAKSDLKFIECAGNGSVVLASPTVYSNTVKDGETGFIYHDAKEFYNKLKILINNKDKRIAMAENAYNYVKHNRLLSQHYEERWDWYNELLARLPELNEETRKRIEILKEKGASAFGGFGDITEKIEVY